MQSTTAQKKTMLKAAEAYATTYCREASREAGAQWTGPETAYLGNGKWVFSSTAPQEVTFACAGAGAATAQLPQRGVVTVPPGCAAHTDEWILPASLTKKLTVQTQPFVHDLLSLNVTITPVGEDPPLTQPTTEGVVAKNRRFQVRASKVSWPS